MRQWRILYGKEMLEMSRSGKWLWVPIVFIILGIMNPITSYYMPEILKNAGNLPQGAIIQIPVPTGSEVMVKTLSQYGTLGVLILVLSFMGVVASERMSGAAAMILVKPVRHGSYISAKWAGMLTMMGISFLAGYLATWYYTEALIGHVDWGRIAAGYLLYGLWLTWVMTLTLLMSVWLKGGGAIAFLTLLITAAVSLLTSLLPRFMKWSPARLSDQAGSYLMDGKALPALPVVISVTLLLIAGLLLLSIYGFKRQELAE